MYTKRTKTSVPRRWTAANPLTSEEIGERLRDYASVCQEFANETLRELQSCCIPNRTYESDEDADCSGCRAKWVLHFHAVHLDRVFTALAEGEDPGSPWETLFHLPDLDALGIGE